MHRWRLLVSAAFALVITFTSCVQAQEAAQEGAPIVRVRGTLEKVSPGEIIVRERGTNEIIALATPPSTTFAEVYPIKLEDIRAGSYVGVGAMPQADGTQRAIAVTVFPESARGAGEGHRRFDLAPQATMTNATVADVAAAPTGRTLRLRYADGEKAVVVPAEAPVVTFRSADRSLAVPGASVSISARMIDGVPTALRANVGRSGFVLPY